MGLKILQLKIVKFQEFAKKVQKNNFHTLLQGNLMGISVYCRKTGILPVNLLLETPAEDNAHCYNFGLYQYYSIMCVPPNHNCIPFAYPQIKNST